MFFIFKQFQSYIIYLGEKEIEEFCIYQNPGQDIDLKFTSESQETIIWKIHDIV